MTTPTTPIYPDDYTPDPVRQYTLHFYIRSVAFTRDVIEGRTSLGGSESACLSTARGLAARGHQVTVFTPDLDTALWGQMVNGITWIDATSIRDQFCFADIDAFTALRLADPFNLLVPARHIALWNQDLLIDPASAHQAAQADQLLYVSDYQRRQWIHRANHLATMPSAIVMNPIDVALVPSDPAPGSGDRYLVHTSRPERSYDALARIWPRIRERHPDLTLRLYRYQSMYDQGQWQAVCDRYEEMISGLDGVEVRGCATKGELYRAVAGAQALLYPTSHSHFAETNCITMTEAMACQTAVVADRRGAIPETLHPDGGILVDNPTPEHWRSTEYLDAVVEAVDGVLERPAYPATAYRAALGRDGSVAAWAWERRLDTFFDLRYRSRKIGVLRQLLTDDNHVAARLLATEIADDEADGSSPASLEAHAALQRCDDVISQRAQTADDYGKFAIQDALFEGDHNGRFGEIISGILARARPGKTVRVLDVACGNGAFAIALVREATRRDLSVVVDAVDYSERALDIGRRDVQRAETVDHVTAGAYTQAVRFLQHTIDDFRPFKLYDAVWCGEYLEHVAQPHALIDRLESWALPAGRCFLSTPSGPFSELLPRAMPLQRGHTHCFTARHIADFMRPKQSVVTRYLYQGGSPRSGRPTGFWIVSWAPGGDPAPPVDYRRQLETERPYSLIHAALITKNAEDHILPCVKSLQLCDAIHIYDTGSTDRTVALAESAGATVVRGDWPDDFSEARNRSLQLAIDDGADWVLWIDGDEMLHQGAELRRLAHDASPYNGIILAQRHLQADQPNFDDKPVRLLRIHPTGGRPTPRFFGTVHEQPEHGLDENVLPSLYVEGTYIVHVGYRTPDIRAVKAQRNHALLRQEIDSPGPIRKLSKALWMRDLCQYAEAASSPADAEKLWSEVIRIWRDMGWDNPENDPILHSTAWPFYQRALQALGRGIHVQSGVAAAAAGPADAPPIEKFLAADPEDARRLLAWRVSKALQPCAPPEILLT